ncbi:MAG: hypothetical protein LUD72_06970 [Bacteroidales bacterium]|nr:hypothetical protein [Bacteroidales bacterium]
MAKSSQRKGRDAEITLAKILQTYGYQVRPGAPVSYGSTPDLTGLKDIHIECKRVEKLNVMEAMHQAIRDSERFGDGFPTLFHKRSREPWLVTMRIEDWIMLYDKYYEGTNGNERELHQD